MLSAITPASMLGFPTHVVFLLGTYCLLKDFESMSIQPPREEYPIFIEFCLYAGSSVVLSTGHFTTFSISVKLLCGTLCDVRQPVFIGLLWDLIFL